MAEKTSAMLGAVEESGYKKQISLALFRDNRKKCRFADVLV